MQSVKSPSWWIPCLVCVAKPCLLDENIVVVVISYCFCHAQAGVPEAPLCEPEPLALLNDHVTHHMLTALSNASGNLEHQVDAFVVWGPAPNLHASAPSAFSKAVCQHGLDFFNKARSMQHSRVSAVQPAPVQGTRPIVYV